LDDREETGEMDRLRGVLLVEPEDSDPGAVRRAVVDVRTRIHRAVEERVEVREVQDEEASGAKEPAERPECLPHVPGIDKVVERGPETYDRVERPLEPERPHVAHRDVGPDARLAQGPPGHADHARGEVAARDLEAPLRER